MKPKDLKYPFSWSERHPALSQGVLFIPQYYDLHDKWISSEWKHHFLCEGDKSIFVEYCSGNGSWIIEKARAFPNNNWIAVERKFERVRKIWAKMQNLKLTNLLIVCGEALTFTKHYLPGGSIDGIYVNFPDPWPKQKHAKNRLFQEAFVCELSRVVKDNEKAILVTDDLNYSKQMHEEMTNSFKWQSMFTDPFYVSDWPEYGSSYFEQLWREKGRTIYYLAFTNCKHENLC
jgi:tRNA (guanine-N7-)-methyltransferase